MHRVLDIPAGAYVAGIRGGGTPLLLGFWDPMYLYCALDRDRDGLGGVLVKVIRILGHGVWGG